MAFAGLAKKAIAMADTSKKITGQVLNRIIFRLCDIQKKEEGQSRPSSGTSFNNYFLAGCQASCHCQEYKGSMAWLSQGLVFSKPR